MTGTLHEAARLMATAEDPEEGAQRALDYLDKQAVRMRILQARLDDAIRTLNPARRAKLADYTRQKLAPVLTTLKGMDRD